MVKNFINSKKNQKMAGGLALSGAFISGLMRIIPHVANFSPSGTLFLYSGARLRGWRMLIIPTAMMLISNLLLHFIYNYPFLNGIILFTLGALLLNILLGLFIRNTKNPLAIGGAAVLASMQFFIVSNFGVWLLTPAYAKSLTGLLQCYTVAIPFYATTMAGDLIFTAIIFMAHHLLGEHYKATLTTTSHAV